MHSSRVAFLIAYRAIAFYLMLKRRAARRKLWSSTIFLLRDIHGHGTMLRDQLDDSPEKFFNFTRMTESRFMQLLQMLTPKLRKQNTRLRNAISPYDRLAMCLRFLATGNSFHSMSFAFRAGTSTVHGIVLETCRAIISVLKPKYLKMPATDTEWETIAKGFEYRWNFPQCIGAIDGKHVRIQKPRNAGSAYINYKGFHSIVLMAACDAQYCFTFVHAGDYGRCSDGGVFKECYLSKKLINNDKCLPKNQKLPYSSKIAPFVCVADEAFPLQTHLLRPFPGSYLDKEKRIYNYRLSRARRCIENAFGILVARWRVLLTTMSLKPEYATLVTMACCCLHNFLMKSEMAYADRSYCPSSFADRPAGNGVIKEGPARDENTLIPLEPVEESDFPENIPASVVRSTYCEYFNNEGSVPWQSNKV